jgi:hypothetical protein
VAAEVPDAPTNLVRLHASSAFITIGWSQPNYNGGTGITSYKVYWDLASNGLTFTLLENLELADSLLYTYQQGLITGKTYRFKVSAVNWIGESPLSQEIQVIAADFPE